MFEGSCRGWTGVHRRWQPLKKAVQFSRHAVCGPGAVAARCVTTAHDIVHQQLQRRRQTGQGTLPVPRVSVAVRGAECLTCCCVRWLGRVGHDDERRRMVEGGESSVKSLIWVGKLQQSRLEGTRKLYRVYWNDGLLGLARRFLTNIYRAAQAGGRRSEAGAQARRSPSGRGAVEFGACWAGTLVFLMFNPTPVLNRRRGPLRTPATPQVHTAGKFEFEPNRMLCTCVCSVLKAPRGPLINKEFHGIDELLRN
jgi:hypothetical protein